DVALGQEVITYDVGSRREVDQSPAGCISRVNRLLDVDLILGGPIPRRPEALDTPTYPPQNVLNRFRDCSTAGWGEFDIRRIREVVPVRRVVHQNVRQRQLLDYASLRDDELIPPVRRVEREAPVRVSGERVRRLRYAIVRVDRRCNAAW